MIGLHGSRPFIRANGFNCFIITLLSSALLGTAALSPPQVPLAQVNPGSPISNDPCTAIAGQAYAAPALVRECLLHFPFNDTLRHNILDVVGKTINFHASLNYQLKAPEPFADTHVDLMLQLDLMRNVRYATDFDFHLAISRLLKRLNDGHAAYLNNCYDNTWGTYLPFPLVSLNDPSGSQGIYITPEAYDVVSIQFRDYIETWQNSSGLDFKKYSGAKVLSIDNQDPWSVVDASADNVGGFQAKSTRQNSFFSSYIPPNKHTPGVFTYRVGDFASIPLPIKDSTTLTVQVKGENAPENITVPYISYLRRYHFTNATSFWAANCVATSLTNGVNYHATSAEPFEDHCRFDPPFGTEKLSYFIDPGVSSISLPPYLAPSTLLVSGSGSAMFYVLPDSRTAVLTLGDFYADYATLKNGIQKIVDKNTTNLIVDVTNNGGGRVCVAQFLHRLLSGANPEVDRQAGLDSKARSNPLAQAIVKKINAAPVVDPYSLILFDPSKLKRANATKHFNYTYDWLDPDVKEVVNGRPDAFSQRLADVCSYDITHLTELPPYNFSNVAILSNGQCGSACSLFSINMKLRHGVKTVVVGGKEGVDQQYCGMVGGEATDFKSLNTDIKTLGLKDHPDAPPDFMTNSMQRFVWRLAYSLIDTEKPEEWASHPADVNMALTAETVNNPQALWIDVAKKLWG